MTSSPSAADTIAAVATPPGSGGVGIVRVSGPRALEIVARVVDRAAEALVDRSMLHAVAVDPDRGERLDEVLCVAMRGPRSYTGEDVAELHGHGGSVNMARLLRAVLSAGARPAEPGEFTRRAFENGRLDLVRAEAVLGIIEAASERAVRLAQAQLAGGLGARVGKMRQRAIGILAELEASIDFPEEGIDPAGAAELATGCGELATACSELAASFAVGRALLGGIEVALVGPVNAGKSSLLNALVGGERALVAAEPGTTRDFVEARVEWDGVAVTLIDTAGWRAADSEVERRGIELGTRRASEADVEVELVPAGSAVGGGAEAEPASAGAGARQRRRLRVVSKGDMLGEKGTRGLLVTSAVTGRGLDELRREVLARVFGAARVEDESAVVTSERQRVQAAQAAAAFQRAAGAAGQPEEVLALEVREGAQALAQLVGDEVQEEMLDALFARFCIGK
jgi:tRNA modification GTPase